MDTIERAMKNNVQHIKPISSDLENAALILELNELKNRVRGLPECPETHEIRAFVGERRWENRVLSEAAGSLAQAEQEFSEIAQQTRVG